MSVFQYWSFRDFSAYVNMANCVKWWFVVYPIPQLIASFSRRKRHVLPSPVRANGA